LRFEGDAMAPSNDFARPERSRTVRFGRLLIAVVAAGLLAIGAVRALMDSEPGVSSVVRAASVFPLGAPTVDDEPRYVGDLLERPRGYERWVAVGASLGLGYSESASPHEAFHQVFIAPSAFDAFLETGAFPEGTMLALEIASVGSSVLPARTGRFADTRDALELAVKDRRQPGGWAYYSFGDGTRATARPFAGSDCAACHRAHAQTDNVFTQFYPRLRSVRRG
jgi:hypothetical protein